jgi:hypothetical protein
LKFPDLPGLAALVEKWRAGEVDRLGLVDSAVAQHARKRAEPDSEAPLDSVDVINARRTERLALWSQRARNVRVPKGRRVKN